MYFVVPYFCNKNPIYIELVAPDYEQIDEFFRTKLNIKLEEMRDIRDDPEDEPISESEIKELLEEYGWCEIKIFSIKFDDKMKKYFRDCEKYHDEMATFCIVKSKIIETKEIMNEVEEELVC